MSLPLLVLVIAGGLTVEDDLGRTVTLPGPAARIVSLAPAITESLFAIGAGPQLAGVTRYCDYPPEAEEKPSVGGMTTPSIETIIALRPDLVLATVEGNIRDDVLALERLEIPVFVTNPRSLEGIRRSIRDLGTLTGRTREADSLARHLAHVEDSLRQAAAGRSVRTLLILSLQPLVVAGRGTFLHDLMDAAGAENLGAVTGGSYPTINREAVAVRDPEVLLLLSDAADTSGMFRAFPEWRTISAIRHGRLHVLDADLMSRPGPRAIEALARLTALLNEARR